jgi:hypothetical protein
MTAGEILPVPHVVGMAKRATLLGTVRAGAEEVIFDVDRP